YTPDDPLIERRLLSPGAAWIVREILESNPRPGEREGMFDVARRPRVAWKTGTSYGFRDAWALGGTRRYTVGVWVGRPDGTPLPGQYGALTALPLLFEVVDSLPRGPGDGAPVPPPPSVEKREVCWPLGTAIESQPPELCQRRFEAWVLDRVVPPTLAEREARAWSAGIERFEVDAATGLRLSAHCRRPHVARPAMVARWPALASPWLPASTRRASTLPPLSPDCADDGRGAVATLRIEGLAEGAVAGRGARDPGGAARGRHRGAGTVAAGRAQDRHHARGQPLRPRVRRRGDAPAHGAGRHRSVDQHRVPGAGARHRRWRGGRGRRRRRTALGARAGPRSAPQRFQHVLGARDLELARCLDEQVLDHAVLGIEGEALAADAHAVAAGVHLQAHRASEVGVAVRQQLQALGHAQALAPGLHHERIVYRHAGDLDAEFAEAVEAL